MSRIWFKGVNMQGAINNNRSLERFDVKQSMSWIHKGYPLNAWYRVRYV